MCSVKIYTITKYLRLVLILDNICVSIVCNAYNHEKYIADSLDSFIEQKTNFGFEILVHDDASTDRTADIIREYQEKYPDIIKPIYQTENQYSKGVKISRIIQYPRAQGKYVAFCEGDDYWTDCDKLQKQYDILQAHPGIDICAHAASRVKPDTKDVLGCICPAKSSGILAVEQVVSGGGGFVATNSLMFRKNIFDNLLPFYSYLEFDYTLQILGSLRGGMYYIADNMAAYRQGVSGSWTERIGKEKNLYLAHLQKCKEMLNILNADTNGKYKKVIDDKISHTQISICELTNSYRQIFSDELIHAYKKLPLKQKLKIFLKAYIPFLID